LLKNVVFLLLFDVIILLFLPRDEFNHYYYYYVRVTSALALLSVQLSYLIDCVIVIIETK